MVSISNSNITNRNLLASLLLAYCITYGTTSYVNGREIIKNSADEFTVEPFIDVLKHDYITAHIHRQEAEVSVVSSHSTSDASEQEDSTVKNTSDTSDHGNSVSHSESTGHGEEGHESHPYVAILFPWFVVATGIFVFYIITRYCHFIPYTAILFLIGTIMGVAITNTNINDQLTTSIRMWENINSELLLLAFLPGLLFKDAYGLDFHLFTKAFGQILIMAFPMVLAGTYLMALVGEYILPYNWNFDLSMTFGAILSATDPVAVSALLNEVGAPPRLKTHIAGESLLNDGSAMVFFKIFKTLYLYDIGLEGGKQIGVGEGIATFVNMSIGAAAVGSAFGFALLIVLYLLRHRHCCEENIVQVSATIATAYLSYYVAEVICNQSGVLSVVFCGIVTKAFSSSIINDHLLMDKFWVLVEHLLNTVLFALGGVCWGTVISSRDPTRTEHFDAPDWGYLIVVYLLMTIIRFLLFGVAFPIISRIGLKSNWKEMLFQSFGGLRGAVGIALAISLDNEVIQDTDQDDPRRTPTSQLLGITGGIALLTLFINGILACPLIKKLKLSRASKERQKIIKRYEAQVRRRLLEKIVRLLGEDRFKDTIDYDCVQIHIPHVKNITATELKYAVRRVKESTPVHLYKEPNLSMFHGHVEDEELECIKKMAKKKLIDYFKSAVRRVQKVQQEEDGFDDKEASPEDLVELRLLFLELLRHVYMEDVAKGEIDTRRGIAMYELNKGLAITKDDVFNGRPIKDWENSQTSIRRFFTYISCSPTMSKINYFTLLSSFVQAHQEAQEAFLRNFCSEALTTAEIEVLDEVDSQVKLANDCIQREFTDGCSAKAKNAISLMFCSMVLNDAALIVDRLVTQGLLKQAEGANYLEEIDHKLDYLYKKTKVKARNE